jgi:hypothetical protein
MKMVESRGAAADFSAAVFACRRTNTFPEFIAPACGTM